jgi:hypothetical protein
MKALVLATSHHFSPTYCQSRGLRLKARLWRFNSGGTRFAKASGTVTSLAKNVTAGAMGPRRAIRRCGVPYDAASGYPGVEWQNRHY